MRVGVPKETAAGERRVGLVPDAIGRLEGFDVAVERGAGEAAGFPDEAYAATGTIAPARALVLGAGVAGLQAIATARRLGAVVSGFDVRPAVREQVQSLGASFLDLGVVGEETEGGYARELTPEEQAKQQQAL